MYQRTSAAAFACILAFVSAPAFATSLLYSNNVPDGKMATTSRPASSGKMEIETADDFSLSQASTIESGSFTGLLTAPITSVKNMIIKIYSVFPTNSGAPSGNVPTRTNSPADTASVVRNASLSELSYTATTLASSFTASNSIQPGGIHPLPNDMTGGNGVVTGSEVEFDFSFLAPLTLDAGQYFFVPEIETNSGQFLWLSAARPVFVGDQQSWIRDDTLAPDWLRVGTDIVGTGSFNAAFSLSGTVVGTSSAVPEAPTWALLVSGFLSVSAALRRRPPMARSGASERALSA